METGPNPSTDRSPRRALRVLGVVVLVLGLLAGLYFLTLGRSPLTGERAHDFGVVMLGSSGATVEHTFTLTNRSRRTLELGRPRTSCGCTVSNLSDTVLEPGETVAVTATLSLVRAGRRSSEIAVPIEGRGVHTLSVTAYGRPEREIHSRRGSVQLWREHDAILGFSVQAWPDVWEDVTDVPGPTVAAPEAVSTELITWTMRKAPDGTSPAEWNGQVSLRLVGDELPEDAHVTVTLREGQLLRVPIWTRPANDEPDAANKSPE